MEIIQSVGKVHAAWGFVPAMYVAAKFTINPFDLLDVIEATTSVSWYL